MHIIHREVFFLLSYTFVGAVHTAAVRRLLPWQLWFCTLRSSYFCRFFYVASSQSLPSSRRMSQSLPSSPRSFADECPEQDKLRGALRLKSRKWLSKQLSMCETPRDVAWEKRRRQMLRQGRMAARIPSLSHEYPDDITYEDLNELKGCIDLGFGFKEEDSQLLANTLPALDIYFAVNRQLNSGSAGSTPRSLLSSSSSSSSESES